MQVCPRQDSAEPELSWQCSSCSRVGGHQLPIPCCSLSARRGLMSAGQNLRTPVTELSSDAIAVRAVQSPQAGSRAPFDSPTTAQKQAVRLLLEGGLPGPQQAGSPLNPRRLSSLAGAAERPASATQPAPGDTSSEPQAAGSTKRARREALDLGRMSSSAEQPGAGWGEEPALKRLRAAAPPSSLHEAAAAGATPPESQQATVRRAAPAALGLLAGTLPAGQAHSRAGALGAQQPAGRTPGRGLRISVPPTPQTAPEGAQAEAVVLTDTWSAFELVLGQVGGAKAPDFALHTTELHLQWVGHSYHTCM